MGAVEVNGYTIESGSDLSETDLTRAKPFPPDLNRAVLTAATADSETIWPERFDPVGAGVIFE